jgi:hypothetical protein
MKRNELQNKLRELGFENLCDDGKTLVAYNCIQYYVYSNHTPMKDVEDVYLDNGQLRAIINGYDDEIGYSMDDELFDRDVK